MAFEHTGALWPAQPAKVAPAVLAAMAAVGSQGGNPSSVHRLGQAARQAVEQAERHVRALLSLGRGGVQWTRAGAAAEALAIEAALLGRRGPRGGTAAFLGPPSRWADTLAALTHWRPHGRWQAVALAAATDAEDAGAQLPSDRAVCLWQDAAPGAPSGALDVLAFDAFVPTTGARQPLPSLPAAVRDRWPAAGTPHLHCCFGAFGSGFAGEAWQPAWAALGRVDTLTLPSVAIGGPDGLAALVTLAGEGAELNLGTVPKELAVGMGAAAALVAAEGAAALAARRRALLAACKQAPPPAAEPAGLLSLLLLACGPGAHAAALLAKCVAAGCNLSVLADGPAAPRLRCLLQPNDAPSLIARQLEAVAELGQASARPK